MADYIVNLNKKDSSITLQKVEHNITLVKQDKQINLQHVGRKGEKGDKGDQGEPGGAGTTVHSELTNLSYSESGHTGFQPAGSYITEETDPVFTAWDKDYDDLTNKPTIPDELADLSSDATHRTVTDTEKSTWNAKQEALTADVDYLTPTTASTAYEPLLPATPTDPELKYLNGNRQFAPIAIGGGGFAANLYYTTIPSDVPGYYKLSYTAETAETILSGVVKNNEVLFRTYLFDSPIDTTIIDGGVWGSVPWLRVSNATGVTRVKIELFVRHIDNTETTLFHGYTEEINNTTIARFKSETTQQSFTVAATDRLGARVYGTTTSNAAITIYSVIGDGNASYFTTPLRIRHDQLRDLNNDQEYQHMTSSEKIVLDNTSGTNTGDNATNTQYSGLETSKLNINQTSPQTTVGTFTFPQEIINGTLAGASGTATALSINPKIAQSGTAGYTALLVNATESSVGSGAKYLMDIQSNTSSRLRVTSSGLSQVVGANGTLSLSAVTDGGTFNIFSSASGSLAIYASGASTLDLNLSDGALKLGSTTRIGNTGIFYPRQSTTAAAPAYEKGAIYFDTTLNKLRVGGATAWETITSV